MGSRATAKQYVWMNVAAIGEFLAFLVPVLMQAWCGFGALCGFVSVAWSVERLALL